MLHHYPEPEDWDCVRFSDEVHFGWGPQEKLHIIQKTGDRYKTDCLYEASEPRENDMKRFHYWAAEGFNFKSDIYFYEVPGNINGKMSQKVYLEKILKPIVGGWLDAGHDFALKEDGDSGHGPSRSNIVRTWKDANHVDYFFNCASSPDLAPIENCWQPIKDKLQKCPHWDDTVTRSLVVEGWQDLSQDFINKRVRSMPDRLRAVIEGQGIMTGY